MRYWQHILLYLLFIPAFTFIILAGNGIEIKAKEHNCKVIDNVTRIDSLLNELMKRSESNIIDTLIIYKALHDSVITLEDTNDKTTNNLNK